MGSDRISVEGDLQIRFPLLLNAGLLLKLGGRVVRRVGVGACCGVELLIFYIQKNGEKMVS